MDRIALQQAVSDLVNDNTVHRVIHTLVEVCYRRAKLCANQGSLEVADRWSSVGRTLTQVEGVTHALDL